MRKTFLFGWFEIIFMAEIQIVSQPFPVEILELIRDIYSIEARIVMRRQISRNINHM